MNAIARRLALLLLATAACASGGSAAKPTSTASNAPGASAPPGPGPRSTTAGSGAAIPGAPASATPPGDRPPSARELSPKARRLFDEAVAAQGEAERLKIPTDWETLERRWRAVTEAEAVPEAWFNLGVALERRRKPDEARAAYRRALELEPALAPAAVNLALLDEPKDPRQAAQVWTEVLRRHPQEALPRVRLAAIYQDAGQPDEAWRLAREALVRDPRSVGAHKVMMRVALQRGNVDLALLLALKAQKLEAADPEIVAFVGDVLARQKDEPAALVQWKRALALKSDYLPARYALLRVSLAKQAWEAVAEESKAILAADPSDARVQLALGVAYRYLGQPDKALAAYDQADKLSGGKLPEVHLARGVVFMKSKEQCEPALAELKSYVLAAGPGIASEGPAMRLERECMDIVAANRQAEEAAREMKAEAERQAAKKAPAPAVPTAVPPATPKAATPAIVGSGSSPVPEGVAAKGAALPTR